VKNPNVAMLVLFARIHAQAAELGDYAYTVQTAATASMKQWFEKNAAEIAKIRTSTKGKKQVVRDGRVILMSEEEITTGMNGYKLDALKAYKERTGLPSLIECKKDIELYFEQKGFTFGR